MRDARKRNVLGIMMDAVDYQTALNFIFEAAREKRGAAISALAVHGLMTGAMDREQKFRLNHFDLLLPDGQPVRWALNRLHNAQLGDRVYGPKLTGKVCELAANEGVPVYFYGSTPEILAALRPNLEAKYPQLKIAGMEPSKFRRMTSEEKMELAARIRNSGAAITFVGLGCPRQEIFTFEFRDVLRMPILAVGAAFPFLGRQGFPKLLPGCRTSDWSGLSASGVRAAPFVAALCLSESRIPFSAVAPSLGSIALRSRRTMPCRRVVVRVGMRL